MDDESLHETSPINETSTPEAEAQARLEPEANGNESIGGEKRPPLADHRYERPIDVDSETTHARVVRLVGAERRVLELGPATGHMSHVLADRGCSIVGIEVDAEMAREAGQHCEKVIVGDLDELDLDVELGDDRFDVIVAADVLEHLKDPLGALIRLRSFLTPGGFFVISLPNIAHGSVRLALLEGHFSYRNVGLLDATHLRFFTRESIDRLLDDAELAAAEIYRQELDIEASEIPFDRSAVPREVWDTLLRDPEARTYQFVIKAVSLDAPGMREFQRRMRELAHENARLREQAGRPHREDELRRALINAHDQLLRRDEQIRVLQQELSTEREQALRLRVRLERILNSPPGRAYAKLGQIPGVRGLAAVRRAGYEATLRSARARDAASKPHG